MTLASSGLAVLYRLGREPGIADWEHRLRPNKDPKRGIPPVPLSMRFSPSYSYSSTEEI